MYLNSFTPERDLVLGRRRPAAALATAAVAAAALLGAATSPAQGQSPGVAGWDAPAALQLVGRAIARRALPLADTTLQQYSARADGTVQFLLESEAAGGAVPLRLDQVSVDLYWQAPGRSRQAIRALRKEDLLPIRQFHYYADRLTLVQEGFGDRISIGDEQDVRGVPHPLSSDGPRHYHYLLADTITLHVPGLSAPIRVVRIGVRPRDAAQPAFVGDVFVDAEAATLVRMRFSFTPASYVDPRTERIHVSVEHGLWEGRYWLPHRQELEVRRQAPEIDFGVASVIRARLTVLDYDFDTPVLIPEGMPRITYPPGEGDVSRFEESLAEAAAREGLRTASVDDLAAAFSATELALRMLRREPDGLPALRFHVPSFSSVVRANRAEGVAIGGGVSLRAGTGTLVTLQAGFATGAEHGTLAGAVTRAIGSSTTIQVTGRLNAVQEIEPAPESGGFINTVATLLAGRDWTDPYYVDGVGVHVRSGANRRSFSAGLEAERHRPAVAAWRTSPWSGADLRNVLPVDSGTRIRAVAAMAWRSHDVAPLLSVTATTAGGAFAGDVFGTALAHVAARIPTPDAPFSVLAHVRGGASVGAVPPQHLYLPAGTRTLPGVLPTTLAGSRFAAGGVELSLPLGRLGPVPMTAHAAVNSAIVGGREHVPAHWSVNRQAIARAATGVGVSAYGGIVRVDYSHGLPGVGEWRVRVSPAVAPLL